MPWLVQKRDGQYCVYKEQDGEPVGESLGCHSSARDAQAQLSALYAAEPEVKARGQGPVRIKQNPEGDWVLEVLGAPYGGTLEGNRDRDGEYFSERTDFVISEGEKRPVFYYHGRDPSGYAQPQPELIGVATAKRRDEQGQWFDVVLDKTKDLANRVWEAAIRGLARASSGAISHLVRTNSEGEILYWPLAELTLLDKGEGRMPSNSLAMAYIKHGFKEAGLDLPEAFVEVEETEAEAEQSAPQKHLNLPLVAALLWRARQRSNDV